MKKYFPDGCGGVFTSDNGQFTSPSYPKEYPNNKECVTTISVNPSKVVKLNFHRSELFFLTHITKCISVLCHYFNV